MVWERPAYTFDLTGKRAFVLGVTEMGTGIALALAQAGADVAICAATVEGEAVMRARRAARSVEELGRRAFVQAIDATLGQGVQVTVRQAAKELGGLDILVTATDHYVARPLEKTSDAEWSQVLAVNLSSVFFACRAAAREMEKAGWGRMVLVTSGLGERGVANHAAYGAAKAGVVQLVRTLAQELAPRGIRVNGIAPVWYEGFPGAGSPDPQENLLVRFIPQKRLGRPEEVTALTVYLASEGADFVSGQVFRVDGGVMSHL